MAFFDVFPTGSSWSQRETNSVPNPIKSFAPRGPIYDEAPPVSSHPLYGREESAIYNSYAGVDIVAEIVLPGDSKVTLGELQTISYSIHRENVPVRFIGQTNVAGFVKGPRTIAGSLIFTQFNEYAFYRIQKGRNTFNQHNLAFLADMLPPFDVVITFANEYGSVSKIKILGITIVDEGGTMSVDDLITEQTFTYMARGFEPMTKVINKLPIVKAVGENLSESMPDMADQLDIGFSGI